MRKCELFTLVNQFTSRLRSSWDAVCIVDFNGSRNVSPKQFVGMVDSYVLLMRSNGIEKGDTVAIRLDRKSELIAAIIACVSIGCPYVIINIDYPELRVGKIFKSCTPRTIIDEDFITRASELMDVQEHVPVEISDDEPCLYLYTSGSTGEPKGILHNRRILTNIIESIGCVFDLSIVRSFASIMDYMFIASIFIPLEYATCVKVDTGFCSCLIKHSL